MVDLIVLLKFFLSPEQEEESVILLTFVRGALIIAVMFVQGVVTLISLVSEEVRKILISFYRRRLQPVPCLLDSN